MARYPLKEAGPTKKKKQPSVNPVGVNRHDMYTKTEFPGTWVSIKGEPKSGQRIPKSTVIGGTIAAGVLLPIYHAQVTGIVAKEMWKKGDVLSSKMGRALTNFLLPTNTKKQRDATTKFHSGKAGSHYLDVSVNKPGKYGVDY